MILKYLEMRYEYEKDKDITMLVCSLGFEYKYLNINKYIEVPTSIEWILKEEEEMEIEWGCGRGKMGKEE